jgi:hypothetical protein
MKKWGTAEIYEGIDRGMGVRDGTFTMDPW